MLLTFTAILWQQVPQLSCTQTKENTFFHTVLASFCLGFWCYLALYCEKHCISFPYSRSPHHSWFLVHWVCPLSAVFIPVYSGLFYLIFMYDLWSYWLPFSVPFPVLLYPEIWEFGKKSEYTGRGSVKIWTIKVPFLPSDSTEEASRGKEITSNCGVKLGITRVPSWPDS